MATAAAAVVAQARREIQHHFFSADAVRADRAVPYTPSSQVKARQFGKMQELGVIRREGADRYWLDVVTYDIYLHNQHKRVKLALLALVVVLAVALAVVTLKGG